MSATTVLVSGAPLVSPSSGTMSYHGGSTDYTNLNDSSDSSYVRLKDESAYKVFPLGDMPGDLVTVTAVSIRLRMAQKSNGSDDDFEFAQIMLADGTTAVTNAIGLSGLTGTITNYTLNASTLYYSNKTSWDAATIKLLKNNADEGGSGAGIHIYEVAVDITYLTGDVELLETGYKRRRTVLLF